MTKLGQILDGNSNIDFRPKWKLSLPISASLAAISIVLLFGVGLNQSIDFEGGGQFEVPVSSDVDVAQIRDAIGLPGATVQISNSGDKSYANVSVGNDDLAASDSIIEDLADAAGVTTDDVSSSTIGPSWGSQVTKKALQALGFFFVAVAIYLGWTLTPMMAAGALVAVVHDIAITAGIYAIFRFEVSPATVIAFLTILGYSLYDTVVVYDKVLEIARDTPKKNADQSRLVNEAMNLVLVRSINTTITTVLPVASMLIVGSLLLGGATLRDFSLALFIGLILGTYSSIFVAAPVLVWLRDRFHTGEDDPKGAKRNKYQDSLKASARSVTG